jgi:hypothetical protein
MEEIEIIHPGMLEQMVLISQLLEGAKEYGLEAEVITWALKSMQEDPSQQPYEAFAAGYNEWIK